MPNASSVAAINYTGTDTHPNFIASILNAVKNLGLLFPSAPHAYDRIRPERPNTPWYGVHSSRINRLPVAIRYLDPWLQFPGQIHQSPFVFPFLARLIELLLPGFVKCFEPNEPR